MVYYDETMERTDLPFDGMFHNPVSLETLDLIEQLKALLQERKRKGLGTAEDAEQLAELERVADQVNSIARRRGLDDQERENEQGHEFMRRLKAECATCGAERDVHIIGEADHKEAGITNDYVRCTVCQTEFVNLMPHGMANKIKWMEYLCTQLTTVRADGLTWAEKVPDRAGITLLMDQIADMRERHAEQARKERAHDLTEAKVDAQLEVMRDTLVLRHLELSGMIGGGGVA